MLKHKFVHLRPMVFERPDSWVKANRGGITVFYLADDDGLWFSYTKCSLDDNFSRARGRFEATKKWINGEFYFIPYHPALETDWEDFDNIFSTELLKQEVLLNDRKRT